MSKETRSSLYVMRNCYQNTMHGLTNVYIYNMVLQHAYVLDQSTGFCT
jgi:hypothetical protein